jgi:2-keto-4-pentenoate hydratase/2-oxohepta-3-ene-1,7-dioic acid hydratase in catechol pathway
MKLARFERGNGPEIGIVTASGMLPASGSLPQIGVDITGLIAAWDRYGALLRDFEIRGGAAVPMEALRLLSPVARPGKILAIGLNYADHIAESGMPTPKQQVWFCKHDNAVAAPGDPILLPRVSSMTDYEAELVAVLGASVKHVSGADAAAAVFGYCVGNDLSVRDWQWETPQWMLGKSFDGHAPFGPWITTADEVGDPHRLGIRAIINGETRQNSNTRHLVFSVWDQIAHLSKAMTLSPGDIIFTGTPGGVGAATKSWLKAGDTVRIEIDELGAIEGTCVNEA